MINETKDSIDEIFSLVNAIKKEGRGNIDSNTILLFANLEKSKTQDKTAKSILGDWLLMVREGKRMPWQPEAIATVKTVTTVRTVKPAQTIQEKSTQLAAAITVLVNKFIEETGAKVDGFNFVTHRGLKGDTQFVLTGIDVKI